jgi:hypothetical protein
MDVHHFSYNHNIKKKTLPNRNLAKEPSFKKKPENIKIIFIEIFSFHFWHRFHQFFFYKKGGSLKVSLLATVNQHPHWFYLYIFE